MRRRKRWSPVWLLGRGDVSFGSARASPKTVYRTARGKSWEKDQEGKGGRRKIRSCAKRQKKANVPCRRDGGGTNLVVGLGPISTHAAATERVGVGCKTPPSRAERGSATFWDGSSPWLFALGLTSGWAASPAQFRTLEGFPHGVVEWEPNAGGRLGNGAGPLGRGERALGGLWRFAYFPYLPLLHPNG